MGNREFDEETSDRQMYARRSRWPRFLTLAFCAWLGSYLLGFPGCSRIPYTCAVCRKAKRDHRCLWLKWSDQEDTDCSLWYRDHVERTHSHFWAERPSCRRFGIPGLYGGYACRGGSPLAGLSPIVQREIYQHFGDKLEAKQLFIRLARIDEDNARTWDTLMEWVGEDYPGTWHDWWEKHRAQGTVAR